MYKNRGKKERKKENSDSDSNSKASISSQELEVDLDVGDETEERKEVDHYDLCDGGTEVFGNMQRD